MKIINKLSILFILLLSFAFAKGQNEKPTAELSLVTRYTSDKGLEIRLFPDRKKILELGFQKGFILERSINNSNEFKVIDTIKPFSNNQWEAAINSSENQEVKDAIEIAFDFFVGIKEDKGGYIDMNEGISALRQQKAKEDFQFLVFLLQAIREPLAAQALGLSYTDKSVVEGETYTYRYGLNGESEVYQIISKSHTVKINSKPSRYNREVFTNVGDSKLSFIWLEDELLSGVDIERALQDSDSFEKLNQSPIYSLRGRNSTDPKRGSFDDDSLVNYQKYRYRFFSYTPFGDRVQFAEIEAMPRDLTPPQKPFLKQPKHKKTDEVHIEWEMPGEFPTDFKGFAVARGESNKGRFAIIHDKLLPSNARRFIDKSFIKGKTNYYLIQALDTANNMSSSFPVAVTLIDSSAPSKPIFIDGSMDSLGIVTLNIKLNDEPDLMGYRLYRSNQEDHEFSQIKDFFISGDLAGEKPINVLNDTVTLNSLTPFIYYRAEALDFNYNTSLISDILKVKRIDIIPPTTPVFVGIKVRDDFVYLSFELSRSNDVIQQILYRKTDLNSPWQKLATLEKDQLNYMDKQVKKGQNYYYSLRAVDESGNFSEYALPVVGKPYDNGMRPTVENLRIKQEEKVVTLLWDYKLINENTYFVIYKKNSNGNLVQYDNCIDLKYSESAKKGDTYAIKVFTKDGGQSPLSELIVVE